MVARIPRNAHHPPQLRYPNQPVRFRHLLGNKVPVVVEASTILVNPIWSPVGTNSLTDGRAYFSKAEWTHYPSRFYRIRSL